MKFDVKQALATAIPGAVLELPAGTWAGGLLLTTPLTLRGNGVARFDGLGRGPVMTIRTGGEVVLEGFTFTNAVALAGAAIAFHEGRLTLRDCVFEGCFAPSHGGGALYARGDSLIIERCRFLKNTGRQGGAVLLDQLVTATLRDCHFEGNAAVRGGALRLKEGASARVERCTFVGNRSVVEPPVGSTVDLSGTTTRTPSLEAVDCAGLS